MEDNSVLVAVTIKEAQKYGCPYCGHHSSNLSIAGGDCQIFNCENCNGINILLGSGVKKSSIGIGDPPVYPSLQKHPYADLRAHVKKV